MNRLAGESSPYLRQHRDNPVDWYPWGEEAFERARTEDRPILLSVGYSACHWCHVMAHESFEDDATARVMNELFVNVKVDREERPDVDAIYMEATQAMTGHGGWPMTVFMTPDGRPFYCGTYFPNTARHGMPAFVDVCRAVDDAWRNRRADLTAHAEELTTAIRRNTLAAEPGDDFSAGDVLAAAYRALVEQHDDQWGGFGRAPKFPQTMSLELLLRAYVRNRDDSTLARLKTSLDAMAAGGIYDHLGGGFARYSVDNIWLVPHFEKMLYDQALLIRIYTHAWQVTAEPAYAQVVDESIEYVLRDLRHQDGGFFSAEDADSEGVEGKFYVWTPDEIAAVLGDDAGPAGDWYGVTPEGNFEGANILNRISHRGELLRPLAIDRARRQLFEAREARVRPGLDDKVLTEWNALMIATLAEAGTAFQRPDWTAAAVHAAEFLVHGLRRSDGRWLRSWQADAGAKTLAFAADYAALVTAFVRLAEATGEARWIAWARDCADGLLSLFWDGDEGGVFTTGSDAEALITRPKDLLDNATPSANSLAAVGLLRLHALTGDEVYGTRAREIVRMLAPVAARHPTAFGHLLQAVEFDSAGSTEIVVTGDRPDLVSVVHQQYLPNAVFAWGEPFDSPLWRDRAGGFAYVCENYACKLPIDDAGALAAELTTR